MALYIFDFNAPDEDIPIPDVQKYFVRPEAAVAWRAGKDLEELLDATVDTATCYQIHVNICRRTEPSQDKQYLCHACLGQTDYGVEHMLNIHYDFKTIQPTHRQLIDLILDDFRTLVQAEKNGGHDTIQ